MNTPSLLALIIGAASLNAAQAQSQVQIYGRIDATIARTIGSDTIDMQNGTGTRLGFQGKEDLGGSLGAFFKLEHRFNIDTGAQTNAQRFFQHAYIGIDGEFGRIWMGRDYTPAYWTTMVSSDPFGNATVANFTSVVTGGISPGRLDNQVGYQGKLGAFSTSASISVDTNAPPLAAYPHRPISFSATYDAKPLKLAYGYDNPGADNDRWHVLTGAYAWGRASVRALLGSGETSSGSSRRSVFVAAVLPAGQACQINLAYGRLKDGEDGTLQSRFGAGYYHALSKRTSIYTDLAYDSKAPAHRTGVDIGIRHNF